MSFGSSSGLLSYCSDWAILASNYAHSSSSSGGGGGSSSSGNGGGSSSSSGGGGSSSSGGGGGSSSSSGGGGRTGSGSRYNDSLRAGRSGDRILSVAILSAYGPATYPASHTMGIRSLPGG